MAVKSWSIDPNKTGSLNDGGRKLKIGTFAYKITGCKSVIDKNDPTGNTQQVEIDLSLVSDPSYSTRTFLSVMSDNEQQREIAHKTLVAFAAAAGIGGTITPARLPSFVGKVVVIEAKETAGKGDKADKTYVNINTVESPDAATEEEEPAAEEPPADEEPAADEAPTELTDEEIQKIADDCTELGIDPDPFPTWQDARAAVEEARAAAAATAKKPAAKKPAAGAAEEKKRPWGKPAAK
jgi:hypothetical protein